MTLDLQSYITRQLESGLSAEEIAKAFSHSLTEAENAQKVLEVEKQKKEQEKQKRDARDTLTTAAINYVSIAFDEPRLKELYDNNSEMRNTVLKTVSDELMKYENSKEVVAEVKTIVGILFSAISLTKVRERKENLKMKIENPLGSFAKGSIAKPTNDPVSEWLRANGL